MEWLNFNYWEKLGQIEVWAALVNTSVTFLGVIIAALAVIFVAYLTYLFNQQQSRRAHNIHIETDYLKRQVNALEKVWRLLSYMSFNESNYAIIQWEEKKKEGNKVKTYAAHFGHLKRFLLQELNDVFYKEQAGLHLSAEVREQLFTYRNLVAKLYFKHKNDRQVDDDSLIVIHNPELIKALERCYNELNELLKKELQFHYRNMSL